MCCPSLCYPRTCCCCISPRNACLILAGLDIFLNIIQSTSSGSGLNVDNIYVLLPEDAQENEQLKNVMNALDEAAKHAGIVSVNFLSENP